MMLKPGTWLLLLLDFPRPYSDAMTVSGELLVGLVTHERSRFRSRGLATLEQVSAVATAAGIGSRTFVSDRNDADPHQHSVTRGMVVASARHQAELEARWRAHVAGRQVSSMPSPLTLGMQTRRSFDSVESVFRLLNIDYSHLRVWRHALATKASAALVIEDDAQLVDERVGEILAALLPSIQEPSVLVNFSRSIAVDDLGVTEILRRATTKIQLHELRVTQTDRAITNTVCANLYSHEFLTQLVAFVDRRGLIPVVPIDWRVNEFLLDNPEMKTWWVDRAPFVQGSMHEMTE